MVKDAACPLPVNDKGIVRYIGKREKYQLEEMRNARYGELYFCVDEGMFYLSTGGNDWLTWSSGGEIPVVKYEIYMGTLTEPPTSVAALSSLTKSLHKAEEIQLGIEASIPCSDNYVVIAYKTDKCSLVSIKQGSIETISVFNTVEIDDYTFFYTQDVVYDPEGEIQYLLTWEV